MSQALIPDEALCTAAQSGDAGAMEQIVYRYTKLVKTIARPCFLAGGDGEDLLQEGMIGLLYAVRRFNPDMEVPFGAYAKLCISRRIYSAVRAANAHKHEFLNRSISIEKPLFDDNAEPHTPVEKPISNPESLVIGMEEQKERRARLFRSLSIFEAKVLKLYLAGYSYAEMAEKLAVSVKAVDNAIQRIRRKSATIYP